MLPLSAILNKSIRPAARMDEGAAWHANVYQRESALDMAKRLVRASVPHGSDTWSEQWIARLLKNACGAPRTNLIDLPARFESRQAFFAAALGKGWQVDDDRMADNPAPKRKFALKVLSIIADLPPHHFPPFPTPAKNIVHSAASRVLCRWTDVDVRGLDEGLLMTPEDARRLWEACVKAAAWQRAVRAAKQLDAASITPDLLKVISIPEILDAAEVWRFSQPSPVERNMDMSQKLPPNEDGYEEVLTPDGLTLHAPKRKPMPATALGDDDGGAGEFDQEAENIAHQDEPLDPEPEGESLGVFRARLMQILHDAGVRNLASAFRSATGYNNLDAAIGAGRTRAEIEAQIVAVAHAEMSKNAPPSTSEPKSQNERPAAPKGGQNDRNPFAPATASGTFIRMALFGPSGSGKSYTALNIACNIKPNARVAVIDSERGSARLYAKQFKFDVVEISDFSPQNYINLLLAAERHGYDVVVVDSKSTSGNSFTAWKDATPLQNKLVDAILGVRCHVIATLRVKTAWVLETNERGKQVPRKVGLEPVQRDGIEYEFTLCGEINADHELFFTKSRCPQLADAVFPKAGGEVATILRDWLEIE